ncbi:hypothetical protein [Nostoc sp. CHAB 5715]|uniref:hypothetical protein n=1 Tax=Nostoc sp. CHAB 5715 TaxID=2780400 RepID=UPI001E5CB782|nr:hypothetical protein [Nostoc sp. CHAB 5715]MCC5624703.1 hypothetical protein [Nostoc sp. CHAB 5715]
MTLEKLKQFRTGVYTILGKAKDALFDLMDAVLVTRSVYSFAELSVSPVFRRQWSSVYEAIKIIVHKVVTDRPARREPRVQKRRPKAYPFMTKPRQELRKQLQTS